MKLKNKIDILLIARPDQSLDIYNSLIRDKQLNINCSQSWSTYYQYNKEYTK